MAKAEPVWGGDAAFGLEIRRFGDDDVAELIDLVWQEHFAGGKPDD
jgi:hypothetical protein